MSAFNVDALRHRASAVVDIRRPLPDTGWFKGWDTSSLTELAAACEIGVDLRPTTPLKRAVFGRFVRLLPTLGLEPPPQDTGQEDYAWAGVRCLLAGAGYEAHAELARALTSVHPRAPFRSDISYEQWVEEVQAAHEQCGVPVTLTLARYRDLARAAGEFDEARNYQWLHAASAIHVLKHLRMAPDGLRLMYRGQAFLYWTDADTNDFKARQVIYQLVAERLFGKADGRSKHAAAAPLIGTGALSKMSYRNLLGVSPMSALPPDVLYGMWSGTEPASEETSSFTETGLRLAGVWRGSNGLITVERGDEELVLAYGWRIIPETQEQSARRHVYATNLPTEYDKEALPVDYIRKAFPNLDTRWTAHQHGILAMYDAMISSAVLRYYRRDDLAREYPMIWVMPSSPTPEQSTNNGKTVAMTGMMGAICPSCPITGTKDGDSAPDNRAVASIIRIYGTVCLDDWRPPRSKGHLLYRDTLQRLATGNAEASGEVRENNPTPLMLRESMLINAKCADLPPDLINRSVFMYFGALSEAQRQQTPVASAFTSGKAGTLMRLSALHWVRELELLKTEPIGHPAFRFPVLLSAAVAYCRHRMGTTAEAALAEVAAACEDMYHHHAVHFTEADASGVASEQEGRMACSIRLTDIFLDTNFPELEVMCTVASAYDGGRVSASQLIRARARVCLTNPPHSLHDSLVQLGLNIPSMADRNITASLGMDIRRVMPNVGDTYHILGAPIGDWILTRVPDQQSGGARVKMDLRRKIT